MNRSLAVSAVLFGIVLAVCGLCESAPGRLITGSKHDFIGGIYTHSGQNMVSVGNCGKCHDLRDGTMLPSNRCAMCHVAHRAERVTPLWGRSNPGSSGWVVWNGGSGQALDGTQGSGYLTAAQFAASGSGLCLSCHDSGVAGALTDLSSHHPMAAVVPFGSPGWKGDLASGNAEAGSDVMTETGGAVGCTSCHSMHSSDPSDDKLRRSGVFCLSCHTR